MIARLRRPPLPLGLHFWMNAVVRGELAILAVYAAHDAGLGATSAALGVAYATLVMRFGRTIVAPVLLRLELRRSIPLCFLAVAVGSLALALARGPVSFFLGATAIGTGFGACLLAIKVAYVAAAGRERSAVRPLSVLATSVNLGAAIGPLAIAGLAATAGRPTAFGLAAAAALVAAGGAALTDFGTPHGPGRAFDEPRGSLRLRLPREAWAVLALTIGAFALYSQLYASLPLLALSEGWQSAIGWLFALNAAIVIVLQVPLGRWLAVDAGRRSGAAAVGMGFLSAGVLVIWLAGSLAGAAAGVVLFSVGECLALPTLEAAAAATVSLPELGSLLALSAAAMGIGESVGSFAGVRLAARVTSVHYSRGGAIAAVVSAAALAVAAWGVVRVAERRHRAARQRLVPRVPRLEAAATGSPIGLGVVSDTHQEEPHG